MELFNSALSALTQGFTSLTWQSIVMVLIGCVLLYLAIAKKIEPILLIPIGFGIVLGNLPLAGLSASDRAALSIFSIIPAS